MVAPVAALVMVDQGEEVTRLLQDVVIMSGTLVGVATTPMETIYSARSASSMGTQWIAVGTGMKRIRSSSLDTVLLLLLVLTRWIPIGMPTQEQPTISQVSWTNLLYVTSIMVVRRCAQPTVQIWRRLAILASLLFTPHLESLNYVTSFMSEKQQKASCLFIIFL
jgi:hypothetical protein